MLEGLLGSNILDPLKTIEVQIKLEEAKFNMCVKLMEDNNRLEEPDKEINDQLNKSIAKCLENIMTLDVNLSKIINESNVLVKELEGGK